MEIKSRYITLCMLLFMLTGCKSDDNSIVEVMVENEPASILFIGNSHTNYNGGVDAQFNGFAQSVAFTAAATKVAPSGFTLQDHLNSQATLDAIDSQSWDYIILQENTSRAAYETEEMLESISQFTELLRTNSATIYLFKTWAYDGEPAMNALLDTAYAQATASSQYTTIPIGSYWKTFGASSGINLYNDDNIHPNDAGTYLSAGLFFKKISNYTDLKGVPYSSSLDPVTADLIKEFISNQNL